MSKLLLAFDYERERARKTQAGHAGPEPRLNPAALFIASRKPGTSRATAAYHLDVAARLMGYGKGEKEDWRRVPWWNLKYEDVEDLRGKLLEKVAADVYVPVFVNNVLYAVKSVMKVVWKMSASGHEYLTDGAWMRIDDIAKIPGKKMRKPRYTPADEDVARLIAHLEADTSPRGKRDLAIVGVAGMAGPRASEMVAMDLSDYDSAGKRLRIPQIKVETSDTDIWHPLEPPVTDWLDAWVAVRGALPGPLFTRLEKNGVGVLQRILANSLTVVILRRRGEDVGIEGLTCHSLRRYFVRAVLRATGDLAMAQRLARHTTPATTSQYYDARDSDDRREAIKRIGLAVAPQKRPDA